MEMAIWGAIACGGVVAAAGLLTLMEYLTGTNLGIDELFMRDRGTLIGSGVPGRSRGIEHGGEFGLAAAF